MYQKHYAVSDFRFSLALFLFLLFVSLTGSNSYALTTELIPVGDTLKYLDDGSNQGTAWRTLAFNDSSWASGTAQLGYGDGDESTVVSFGGNATNKYITTYFRRSFTVANAALYTNIILDILRDDGAVVYLNGTEIYRTNMPGGTISYTTTASSAVSGATENQFFQTILASTLLQTGTNVLAVEIHQSSVTSSDISLDLRLEANDNPISTTVSRGPYLQTGTPNSVIVKWRTNISTDSKVFYGTDPSNLNLSLTIAGSRMDHEVQISGLVPDSMYFYAVGNASGMIEGGDSTFHFITSPVHGTRQPIRAWILGDAGTADASQRAVRDAYYNYVGNNHTDMMLFLGDNAYNSGTDTEYQFAVFQNMYETQLRKSVAWSTKGNHDITSNAYYNIFSFPTAAEAGGLASGTEAYYSFDYANIHFIVLESHDTDRSPGGAMMTWLTNDIAATTQEWVVAFWHHPPYTKGSHDSDTEGRLIDMRQNALPILESAGVDLVMCGHSHSYERSFLVKGHYGVSGTLNPATMVLDNGDGRTDGNGAYAKTTTGPTAGDGAVYITSGSSGKISGGSLNHPVMYTSQNVLGSVVMEVDGDVMDVKFITNTGAVNDYLTITKDLSLNIPPTVSVTAPANGANYGSPQTISLEASASDTDGSVTQVEFFVDSVSVGTDTSSPYQFNWTIPANGLYTIEAAATDDSGGVKLSAAVNISVGPVPQSTSSQIAAGDDDVEEEDDGVMYFISTDIELVNDGNRGNQTIGLRFTGLNIPQGATITNAYVQFTVDETNTVATNLTIKGEDVDDAAPFINVNGNVSNRAMTSASASWSPPAWNTVGAAGTDQQTPNISPIVQEIVNRGGFSTSSDMVIIISGTGERTAEAYNGVASSAAVLHVDYMAAPPNAAPSVSITAPSDATSYSSLQTITIDATASDADGSVTFVEFFVDGNPVGVDSTAPYSTTYALTAGGNYVLTAEATDNLGTTTTSTTVNISVNIPVVARGPYLQTGTPTSVIVKWRTDNAISSKVWYGADPGNLTMEVSDAGTTTEHELPISGLTPNTTYYYAIGDLSGPIAGGDSTYHFITSPVPGTQQLVRAWVLGDAGTANSNQRAVRDAYYNYVGADHTDMMLFLGDNAYTTGTDNEYQFAVFEDMYEEMLRKSVAWSTKGNHDHSSNAYYNIFTFPTTAEAGGLASGTEAYYSFDYANIHFIVLESHETDRSPGGAMMTWLTNDIAATTQEWIIAIWHHPPYTKGSHNSDTETQLVQMRQNALPILEAGGVDLVMCGHSHSYERSFFINGHYGLSSTFNMSTMAMDSSSGKEDVDCAYTKSTTGPNAGEGAVYITAGSSGKISGGALNHPAMYASLNQLGSLALEVEGNRLDLKFITNTGTVTDYFTLMKDVSSLATDKMILKGDTSTLAASWLGTYNWNPGGATTPAVSVSPMDTTTYLVTDDFGCLEDTFHVNVYDFVCGKDGFEPNDNMGSATNLFGGSVASVGNTHICDRQDVDWFWFNHTQPGKTFTITMNVPDDFDLELHNGGGMLANSVNPGTQDEEIVYPNAPAGMYYIKVYGANGAWSYNQPYDLTVKMQKPLPQGFVAVKPNPNHPLVRKSDVISGFNLYPNPANDVLSFVIDAKSDLALDIRILDLNGKQVSDHAFDVPEGFSNYDLNISTLAAGSYFVQIRTGDVQVVEKVMVY